MEHKTTSKTSSLKALLLRAWRQRWSDLQWGVHIKSVLPRGVSGDVYNLADCILAQATVGCGANALAISYLKHSLSAQLVSYAAVLQRIAKFEAFHKPHCVFGLLEFVEEILPGVTCRGKLEEGLLAASLLAVAHWLLQVYLHAARDVSAAGIPDKELLRRPSSLLTSLVSSQFCSAMMYLAKWDDGDQYAELVATCREVEALLAAGDELEATRPPAAVLEKLRQLEIDEISPEDEEEESITHCVQALLAVDLLVERNTDTQTFVDRLLTVKRLKGYDLSRLYCELMRACLISLDDSSGCSSKRALWGAFTFLKVPQIIQKINFAVKGETSGELPEISEAFEQLLLSPPLLDVLDSKWSCNCARLLLDSLAKVDLVSEQTVEKFSRRREAPEGSCAKLDPSSVHGSIPTFIVRAKPILTGILKVSADFGKIQDALYSMLCHDLSGKNLEVILAVATVEGQLKRFVSKLIEFNEWSLQPTGDVGKPSQSRALLFDVTFLYLCAIVQRYGADAVFDENGNSFFERWVSDCMVERGAPKSPNGVLQKCDPNRIESLLRQLSSASEFDFKNDQTKYGELCFNIGGAIKEVLFAWEQGSLTANDVKRILDLIKQRMACLAVCASAWLCSYMHVVHQDALLKPMNMVQQFLTPLNEAELAQNDNYKERCLLMSQIIRKMQYDVHPPTTSKTRSVTLGYNIVSKDPISERLQEAWKSVKDRGWIHIEAMHEFESLLNTGGPVWFASNLVKEILQFRYEVDLNKAIDLGFALFHLNIEECTRALLSQVLPQYLYNNKQSEELMEPQSSTLAKLCVYCIFAAFEYTNSSNESDLSKKRRFEDEEDIEMLCPTNKVRRLNDNTLESTVLFGNVFQSQTNNQKTVVLKEPLQSALQELFKTFTQLVGRDGEISPQTHFIFQFLSFIVKCGKDRARIVLQTMPNDLVPTLVKSLPELFTTGFLLRLYDVSTMSGRKLIARDLCILRNMQLRPN